MRIVAASILLASAAIATPAFAQDTAADASFTGGHIEVLAGVDHVSADGEGETGVAYGVAAGYDFAAGGAVLGIEAEVADSSTKQCESSVFASGDELCLRTGRDLYVGGRVGAIVGSNALLYAKVGYTNARAEVTYDLGSTSDDDGTNLDGVRVGAGVETNFGRFLARAEYRYSNYEAGYERHQGVVALGVRF